MRSHDKEHRRSALIQNLRKQQRDQELVLDVLKDTLKTKVGEFNDSLDAVNDFILKKTLGGPKRFRPKTREELELEFVDLDKKYKRVLASLKRAKTDAVQDAPAPTPRQLDPSDPPDIGAMQRDVESLRVLVAAKDKSSEAQGMVIQSLKKRVDELHLVQDKWERTKAKYAASKDAIARLQDEAIRLIQAKELESARREQVEIELACVKDMQNQDAAMGDSVHATLKQQIQALQAQEATLLAQMEAQTQKWTDDRLAILAQIRAQEANVASIEAQSKAAASQVASLTIERDELRVKLDAALGATAALQQTLAAHNDDAEMSNDAAALTAAATKETELLALVAAKDQQLKAFEKQILASKLLARLHKKEKQQLLLQMDKLRTLVSNSAPPTDASRVIAQAQLKLSTEEPLAPSTATIVEEPQQISLAQPNAAPVESPQQESLAPASSSIVEKGSQQESLAPTSAAMEKEPQQELPNVDPELQTESPAQESVALVDHTSRSESPKPTQSEKPLQQDDPAPRTQSSPADFVNGVVASALLNRSKDVSHAGFGDHNGDKCKRFTESPVSTAPPDSEPLAAVVE